MASTSNSRRWTPEEDRYIREAHQVSTPIRVVARVLGRTYLAVRKRRKAIGLPRTPLLATGLVREFYHLGWSDRKIAREFDLDAETVQVARRRLGWPPLYGSFGPGRKCKCPLPHYLTGGA